MLEIRYETTYAKFSNFLFLFAPSDPGKSKSPSSLPLQLTSCSFQVVYPVLLSTNRKKRSEYLVRYSFMPNFRQDLKKQQCECMTCGKERCQNGSLGQHEANIFNNSVANSYCYLLPYTLYELCIVRKIVSCGSKLDIF